MTSSRDLAEPAEVGNECRLPVAVLGEDRGVQGLEGAGSLDDVVSLLDAGPVGGGLQADGPFGAVRREQVGHRSRHEPVGFDLHDLADAAPPDEALTVASTGPGADRGVRGAAEVLGSDALVAPFAHPSWVTCHLPDGLDGGRDLDRDLQVMRDAPPQSLGVPPGISSTAVGASETVEEDESGDRVHDADHDGAVHVVDLVDQPVTLEAELAQ